MSSRAPAVIAGSGEIGAAWPVVASVGGADGDGAGVTAAPETWVAG